MFCGNCGKELDKDSCFCQYCGTQQESNSRVNLKMENPLKKIPKKYLGICVAAIVVVALFCLYLANRKIVIDLNEYVVVRFEGYDTMGDAVAYFDDEAFEEDYGEKIKCIKENFMARYSNPAEYIADYYVSGSLDNTHYLSNGNEVVYHWECQEELVSEYFNCKLKCDDLKIKVEGLKEIVPFDPFENVEVTFEGISSTGVANLEVKSEVGMYDWLEYDVTPSNNLRNGDEVTVKVNISMWAGAPIDEYCISEYGQYPETHEKKYTVSGLGEYITSLEQVSEDIMESMKTQAEKELKETVEDYWSEHEKLEGMTYLGCYFLTSKDPEKTGTHNVMRLVYKVDGSDNYPEEDFYQKYEFYYDVMFEDLKVAADGTCYDVVAAPITSCNSFEREVEYDSVNEYTDTYWYDGYPTLEELEKHFYLGYDNFTYKKNMK